MTNLNLRWLFSVVSDFFSANLKLRIRWKKRDSALLQVYDLCQNERLRLKLYDQQLIRQWFWSAVDTAVKLLICGLTQILIV